MKQKGQKEKTTLTIEDVEKQIRDHYLSRGYKLEKDQLKGDEKWGFNASIFSEYKSKELYVIFRSENTTEDVRFRGKTFKKLFAKAIKHFAVPAKKA